MIDEYIIINKTFIEKRIEELEKDIEDINLLKSGELSAYKEILSQSTPLISEIEKAFDKGKNAEANNYLTIGRDIKQDYISKLKLDI
jgi:hypothetical protein